MVSDRQFGVQSRELRALVCAVLLVILNSQLSEFLHAQSVPFRVANLNQVRFADQFPGADACARINAAIQDLPRYVDAPVFSGTGLNDATSGGPYTGTASITFTVIIDGTGSPDTFKWFTELDPLAEGVPITGAPQELSNGLTIRFASTTGHTLGDKWTINATTGGVVDARGLEGPQNCATNPLAGSKGNVVLLLGAATFNTSVPWEVTASGVKVVGAHYATGTKIRATAPIRLFDAGAFDGIELEHIYFDGGAVATDGLRFGTGVVQEIVLRDLRIYNIADGTGLDLGAAIDCFFERVDVQDFLGNMQVGISTRGADNQFYSVRVAGAKAAGLDLTGAATGLFVGSIFSNNVVDIRVSSNPGDYGFFGSWFENSFETILKFAGSFAWNPSFYSCLLHTSGSTLFDLTGHTGTVSLYGGSVNPAGGHDIILSAGSTLVAHHVASALPFVPSGAGRFVRQTPDQSTSAGGQISFDFPAGGAQVIAARSGGEVDAGAMSLELRRQDEIPKAKVILTKTAEGHGEISFFTTRSGVSSGERLKIDPDGSLVATGELALKAGGTDQNITLTPSGTGIVIANNLYAEESRAEDVVLTGINNSTAGHGAYISTAASDATHYALNVLTNASTSSLYVRTDNRVGIGKTDPAQRLDVNGSATAALNTVAFSATPTFDASLGNTQKITLPGNVTSSTLSNASAGQWLYFLICQDSTGGRTFAWPANVRGGMIIGSAASTCSAQSFVFDGANAYALSPGVSGQ